MIPDFVERLLLVVLGFLLSEIRHWRNRNRDRVNEAAKSYLELVKNGCWPGLALQRCGASGLRTCRFGKLCEFRRFCRRVVVLGGRDPLDELNLSGLVTVENLPRLLREASRRGVLLASDKDLYHFLCDLFLEGP